MSNNDKSKDQQKPVAAIVEDSRQSSVEPRPAVLVESGRTEDDEPTPPGYQSLAAANAARATARHSRMSGGDLEPVTGEQDVSRNREHVRTDASFAEDDQKMVMVRSRETIESFRFGGKLISIPANKPTLISRAAQRHLQQKNKLD